MFLVCLFLLLSQCIANGANVNSNRCVMYDICGLSKQGSLPLFCPSNKTADEYNSDDSFYKKVVNFCGAEFAQSPYLCCSEKQFNGMANGVKQLEPLIVSCPACLANFKLLFCHLTCSGDQSSFIEVLGIDSKPENKTVTYVDSVKYHMTNHFAEGFFTSCKDIGFGMSNQNLWQFAYGFFIMSKPMDLLSVLGKSESQGGRSPYQISFDLHDQVSENGYAPVDAQVKSCSDENYFCPCVDCHANCAPPEPWPLKYETCHLTDSIRCVAFGSVAVFLSLLFILFLWVNFIYPLIKSGVSRKKRLPITRFGDEVVEPNDDEAGPSDPMLQRQQNFNNDEADIDNEEKFELGVSQLDLKISYEEYYFNNVLHKIFYQLGQFVGKYPVPVILCTIAVIIAAGTSFIWNPVKIETSPEKLWVSPNSQALAERKYFDETFGPFWRVQQVMISPKADDPKYRDGIITKENLQRLYDMVKEVRAISVNMSGTSITLQDLCYKPIPGVCLIQTLTDSWESEDLFKYDNRWNETYVNCLMQPTSGACVFDKRAPMFPNLVVGGVPVEGGYPLYSKSQALILTFLLDNSLNATKNKKAEVWEAELRIKMAQWKKDYDDVKVSYLTESSLEIELNRESKANAIAILTSYFVMFCYVTASLGRWTRKPGRFFVDSRFVIGFIGIMIVIASLVISVAIFTALAVIPTLIIAEVIPFLVLAIGVDNIFILIHTFDCQSADLSIEERAARTLGKIGPSICLCAVTETVAFLLGGFVTMPAVSSFAMYAAVAVFADFLLQITCFMAFLVLDTKRAENSRMDCFPCIRLPIEGRISHGDGFVHRFFRKIFAPFLLKDWIRKTVIFFQVCTFSISLYFLFYTEVGLDQTIALPSDSYMIDYFDSFSRYLSVGPPLFFVVRNVNFSSVEGQYLVASKVWKDVNPYSLGAELEINRQLEHSYIAQSTSIWLDDFYIFLYNCEYKGQVEPPEVKSIKYTVQGEKFNSLVKTFLQTAPGFDCPFGGEAAYANSIIFNDNGSIIASNYRTYHSVLKTQTDFIKAMQAGRAMAKIISERNRIDGKPMDVFAYSLFYIFFEQYETIVQLSITILGWGLAAITLLTLLFLGNIRITLIISGSILSILVHLSGFMYLWGITLNAVSLVNMVIGAGISIEFCSHMARAYYAASRQGNSQVSSSDRVSRVKIALCETGASIFTGITLTKVIGVSVLTLAPSQIFQIYYFRMYLLMILIGFVHGLVYLPVLLCYLGPDKVLKNGQNLPFGEGYEGETVTAAMTEQPIEQEQLLTETNG